MPLPVLGGDLDSQVVCLAGVFGESHVEASAARASLVLVEGAGGDNTGHDRLAD